MKFFPAALALVLVAVGANAQSSTPVSTVSAPCGTSCPSAAAPKMITRSAAPVESTPCPSLIVSSVPINGTSPTVSTGSPTPSTFKGAANHIGGSVGAVVAAAAVAFAL